MIEHHPFIEQRRTRTRAKKLTLIQEQSSVQLKGGKRGSAYRNTRTGRRDDLGDEIYRSAWEGNFARILVSFGIGFEYEPKTFYFPLKRGAIAYTPDFYLTKTKEYVELKGWLDPKSATKLTRFKKYYPREFADMTFVISKYSKAAKELHEKLEFKDLVFYEDLDKIYSPLIPNWEKKGR